MSVGPVQNVTMAPGPSPRAAVRDSGAAPRPAPADVAPVQGDPIDRAAEVVTEALQAQLGRDTRLRIEHDEATDRYVFQSVDKSTGEVLGQYPTKEMLNQIALIRELTGLAVDTGS